MKSLVEEYDAFVQNEVDVLTPRQSLARLDSFIARMRALTPEFAGTPTAPAVASVLASYEQARNALATPQVGQGQAGPVPAGASPTVRPRRHGS